MLAAAPVVAAFAQAPKTRVNKVLLARDLDGDGKVDYIVRESSDTTSGAARPARLAIYAGAKPQTVAPAWTSGWDPSQGSDVALARVIRVDTSATLLEVDLPADDVLLIRVLLIAGGEVRELVRHAVGFDDGSAFRFRETGGRITIDATPRNLVVDGKDVDVSLECRKSTHAEARLIFDRATRSFVAATPRCVRDKP
jgi:hypothetical protein